MSAETTLKHHSGHTAPAPVPTLATVAAISATALFVVGQLYATLPLLDNFGTEFGVSTSTAAWTSSVFGFAYAIGMLVAGPLSDVLGRKRVAVCGLLAAAAASTVVALAPTFPALLASRVLQGGAAAFFPPVALAYLTERIDARHRSTALVTVISTFLAAAIVAPLAVHGLTAIGGWRTWFYMSTLALLALALLLSRVLRPDEKVGQASSVKTALVRLPALLKLPRLSALYFTTVTVMWAFVGVTTLAQLAGPGTGNDPGTMQAVRLATLPACVLIPAAGPLLARVPARRRLLTALAVTAVSVAAVSLAPGSYSLAAGLAVMTAGVAAAAPALVETLGGTAPAEQRGSATAVYGFVLFVGASLAAPTATAAHGLGFAVGACCFAALLAAGVVTAAAATRAKTADHATASDPAY